MDAVDVTIWGRYYHDATGARFECSDHRDNDGDGQVDFPADPGCADAVGNSERAAPLETPDSSRLELRPAF